MTNDKYYSKKKMGGGILSRFFATMKVNPFFWLAEFPGISIPFIVGIASMLIAIDWIRNRVCDYSHDRLELWPLSSCFLGTLLGTFIIIWTIRYGGLPIFRGWGIRLTAGPIIALGLVPAFASYVLKHAGYMYTLSVVQAASKGRDASILGREMWKCRKVTDIQSRILNGLVGCGSDALSFFVEWLMHTRLDALTGEMKATLKGYNRQCGFKQAVCRNHLQP